MKFYSSFPMTAQNCLANRAISYGDGVFETMLMNNNVIRLWALHWQRLTSSLMRLNINILDEQVILNKILTLTKSRKKYIVKLVVFRGDLKRGYNSNSRKASFYITLNPYKKLLQSEEMTTSSVLLGKQKKLAGIKHLNRLEQVLAAQELANTEYTDALMCDEGRNVIETISKNIVLIKNEQLYTPQLDESGVYGVALRWLESQGYELNWKKIEFNGLAQYHGLMTCNSIQGFQSVINIDKKIEFKQKSPIAEKIKQQWQEYFKTQ